MRVGYNSSSSLLGRCNGPTSLNKSVTPVILSETVSIPFDEQRSITPSPTLWFLYCPVYSISLVLSLPYPAHYPHAQAEVCLLVVIAAALVEYQLSHPIRLLPRPLPFPRWRHCGGFRVAEIPTPVKLCMLRYDLLNVLRKLCRSIKIYVLTW